MTEKFKALLLALYGWYRSNFIKIFIFALLLVWLDVFLLKEIDLASADLGRHIKNGEIFWETHTIASTNFYSYTYPDYPAPNHHWGSGLIFFLIWKFFGFSGLSFFYIGLSLLTFFILFSLARRETSFGMASVAALLLIPLIAERVEVRPEIFSCFFGAVFLYLLQKFKKNELPVLWLLFLPFLEIIWINTHIYFVFGIFLISVYWIESFLAFLVFGKLNFETGYLKIKLKQVKILGLVLFSSLLGLFLNPFGWKAIAYPFLIFQNYGYRIIENQSVWFLKRLGFIANPNFDLFIWVFAILILSYILLFFFNRSRFSLAYFAIGFTFGTMSALAIRNFTIFGYFSLPILAYNIYHSFSPRVDWESLSSKIIFSILAIAVFSFTFWTHQTKLPFLQNRNRLGIDPSINDGAEFFKNNSLRGPILNNYDIGGYLIFHLFPKEKVFVDNRPEAYPKAFFDDVYIKLQEDEDTWKKTAEQYDFNAIFFYINDATPWGQKFLVARLNDPAWAPVFGDTHAVIFLKRNEKNRDLIGQFEMPKNYFSTKK